MLDAASVYVLGHQSPDTDSVASSIVLARLLLQKKFIRLPSGSKVLPITIGPINNETRYVLKTLNVATPRKIDHIKSGQNVVLVDHASYEESVEGLLEANILGVVDHHRIGGLSTNGPTYYRSEPLGSTCSLLMKMARERSLIIEPHEAALLLAGLISDTLNLCSPTTTTEDRHLAIYLSLHSGRSIDGMARAMFEAKSDLTQTSIKEIVSADLKVYTISGSRIGFGVCETIRPADVMRRNVELINELKRVKSSRGLSLLFFAVVDLIKQGSHLILAEPHEQEVATEAYKLDANGSLLNLEGLISRKKQLLPPILRVLELHKQTFAKNDKPSKTGSVPPK
jgi:manganese-dependent inorganic pyrophosphatase